MKKFKLMLLFTLILTILSSTCSNAAAKYSKIYPDCKSKKGKYTISYTTKKGLNLYVEGNSKPVVSIPYSQEILDYVLNDEKIYYSYNKKIMQFDISTKKKISIKEFKNNPNICAVRDEYIYVTVYPFDENHEGAYETDFYKINMKNKETKLLAKNASSIVLAENNIFYRPTTTDVSGQPLYSIDYNGKNLKKISDDVIHYQVINKKLYFVTESIQDFMQTVYVSNLDGTEKKQLTNSIDGYVYNITPTDVYYAVIGNNTINYKLNLSTKKVEVVKQVNTNVYELNY